MTLIGPSPLAQGPGRLFRRCIGTIYPNWNVLVTEGGAHALHPEPCIQHLNKMRARQGKGPMNGFEERMVVQHSVALIFEETEVQIRPDPENLSKAFEADELLQKEYGISRRHIRFLHATIDQVLQGIKARGECWRITPLPKTNDEIGTLIENARVAIGLGRIYYYNRVTGARFLTFETFARLESLSDAELAAQLNEIQKYARKPSSQSKSEVLFFPAGSSFGPGAFREPDYAALSPADLRAEYGRIRDQFRSATAPNMQRDDVKEPAWRDTMFAALVGRDKEEVSELILRGLSPEFFLQLEWLAGGRIERGELLFDPIFEEFEAAPGDAGMAAVCDLRVRSFLFNFIREYGDIEHVNVARVARSLSLDPNHEGYRAVYLAEIKPVNDHPVVRMIRMQRWDIQGHLDHPEHPRPLLPAMLEAAEYTEYVLDRRLVCRQLGMNLPQRILMHKISEPYAGRKPEHKDVVVWSTYFERNYCPGIATDKIAPHKYLDSQYALAFAKLLGRAAAPNLIVARSSCGRVLFDDGDEVLRETKDGQPEEIVVADPTGSFDGYAMSLEDLAAQYAQPVLKRWGYLQSPRDFASAYLEAFEIEFNRIKNEYGQRKAAFDGLLKHRRFSKNNLRDRLDILLDKLEASDGRRLAQHIKQCIEAGMQ